MDPIEKSANPKRLLHDLALSLVLNPGDLEFLLNIQRDFAQLSSHEPWRRHVEALNPTQEAILVRDLGKTPEAQTQEVITFLEERLKGMGPFALRPQKWVVRHRPPQIGITLQDLSTNSAGVPRFQSIVRIAEEGARRLGAWSRERPTDLIFPLFHFHTGVGVVETSESWIQENRPLTEEQRQRTFTVVGVALLNRIQTHWDQLKIFPLK